MMFHDSNSNPKTNDVFRKGDGVDTDIQKVQGPVKKQQKPGGVEMSRSCTSANEKIGVDRTLPHGPQMHSVCT